jgi:hypothetical protein
MSIFQTILAAKAIYTLGIVNLVTGLMVFFTCRCLPGARIGHSWMQNTQYKRFYKYHCYYWWAFWVSVVVHAIFGLGLLGNPYA